MILKSDTFITEDNNYILELNKKDLNLFYHKINDTNRFIANINIKQKISNTTILRLNLSDTELYNLIDNIEYYLSEDTDLLISIESNNTECKNYIIGLNQFNIEDNLITKYEDYLTKDILTIYSHNIETNTIDTPIVKILSFNVTNSLSLLHDKLLNTFIEE